MTPDSFARLALLLYLAIGVGIVAWQVRSSGFEANASLLYTIERLYVPLMFHWRANRRCPFPAEGGALIVANHRSPVDPLLIWMNNHLGPRTRKPRILAFMMAREYYEIPGLKWIVKNMQCIPVDRQGKDMQPAREALERLKRGHLLVVFPEGRINPDEALLEGDTGIAWLALHARVPVYPVYLRNSPSGDQMVKPFYTPSRVVVNYGDPIDLAHYYDQKRTRTLLREVTDLLMRQLADLGGVPYSKDVSAHESPHAIGSVSAALLAGKSPPADPVAQAAVTRGARA